MILYSANIIGAPAGWARAGACVRAGHAAIYEKRTGPAATWKGLLLLHFTAHRPSCLIHEPVSVKLAFLFQRPKGHTGKRGLKPSAPRSHTNKPDLDNLVKLILDAMVEARVLEDDRCVVMLSARKEWCDPASVFEPGCSVTMETMS